MHTSEQKSYIKDLKADVRRWSARRDAFIAAARALGHETGITAKSNECQAIIDEAQAELARLMPSAHRARH